MDKITRVLLLYSRLLKGEVVNKTNACLELECRPRTFDRDIEDIRLYLSESFSNCELLYDRRADGYFLTEVMQQPLDKAEYLFIEKVLSGSRILCKDEMSGLLLHLALNTDNPKQAKTRQKRTADTYREPEQGEPLLKIFSDLTATIENHQVIQIYGENIRTEYRKIIPCEIQYRDVKLYLSALSADDLRDILIPLQEIESFSIIREQRTNEKIQVQRTIRS